MEKVLLGNSTEIPSRMYIMASVFQYLIMTSEVKLKHSGFQENEQKQAKDDIPSWVFSQILPFLSIPTNETVPSECLQLNIKFWFEISQLSDNLGLGNDSLEIQKIQNSLKKLDRQYQRIFEVSDVDGRFFLEDRKKNITPSKFTPFTKQGQANKSYLKPQLGAFSSRNAESHAGFLNSSSTQNTQNKLNSHRILNYDIMPSRIKVNQNFKEIKFQGMVQSPYTYKFVARETPRTPLTFAMHMDQWFGSKLRSESKQDKAQQGYELDQYLSVLDTQTVNLIFDREITELQNKILDQEKRHDPLKQKERRDQILKYFKISLLQILKYRETCIQSKRKSKESINFRESLGNIQFYKGLYICCAEVHSFIKNQHGMLDFEQMIDIAELSPVDIWRVVSLFLRFDQSMPHPLKKHLLDIEINILSNLTWKNEYSIEIFADQISKDQELQQDEEGGHSSLQKSTNELLIGQNWFYSRIIQHAATQMYHLAFSLELDLEIIEEIWSLVKYIFVEKIHVLAFRQLDTIIFCSIYLVCKVFKINIKFNEIINKQVFQHSLVAQLFRFKTSLLANKSKEQEIIYQVLIDPVEGKFDDIITFYNQVFIGHIKKYVSLTMAQQSKTPSQTKTVQKENSMVIKYSLSKNTMSSGNFLQSPIKELVSSPFTSHPHMYMHKQTNQKSSQSGNSYQRFGTSAMSPTSQMIMMAKNGAKDTRANTFNNTTTGFGNQGYKQIDHDNLKSKKVINFDEYSYSSDQQNNQTIKPPKRIEKNFIEKPDDECLTKKSRSLAYLLS